MEINEIKFIKSSPNLQSCPPAGMPEYAFAGRSNVGKSSLLNYLANIKNLAKISSTPGKTQLINHYLVNNSWYLVDLPGYGFAKTGKKIKTRFLDAIEEYLVKRETLSCLFVLIDSRHKPLDIDITFINKAGTAGIPISLVFTKTDKISASAFAATQKIYRETLHQYWDELPPVFSTSSERGTGKNELLQFIDNCNIRFQKK